MGFDINMWLQPDFVKLAKYIVEGPKMQIEKLNIEEFHKKRGVNAYEQPPLIEELIELWLSKRLEAEDLCYFIRSHNAIIEEKILKTDESYGERRQDIIESWSGKYFQATYNYHEHGCGDLHIIEVTPVREMITVYKEVK